MDRVRVLTLNLWGEQPPLDKRMDILVAGVRELAPDVIALQETLQVVAPLGPEAVAANLNVKDIVGWVARKKGIPEMLITTDEQRKALVQAGLKAQQAQQQNQVQQNAAMNPQPPDAASQGPPLSAQ